MALALSILAIILAVFSLPIAIYSFIIVKATQLSTHKIEYMPAPSPYDLMQNTENIGRANNPTDEVPISEDNVYGAEEHDWSQFDLGDDLI